MKFDIKKNSALVLLVAFLIVFGLTKILEKNKPINIQDLPAVENTDNIPEEKQNNTTKDYLLSSGKKSSELIVLDSPAANDIVGSPVKINGQARGYWFFEANFPITVVNWDGLIIGEGFATAEGEWMTEEFVPFTAEIAYDLPADSYSENGTLILQKANASGEPEFDDALEIPIKLIKNTN